MKLGIGDDSISLLVETPMDRSFIKHEMGAENPGDLLYAELTLVDGGGGREVLAINIKRAPAPEEPAPPKKSKKN